MDLDRAYAAFLASLLSLFGLRCLFRESRLPSALTSLEITEDVVRPPPPGTLSYGLMLLAALPRLQRAKGNGYQNQNISAESQMRNKYIPAAGIAEPRLAGGGFRFDGCPASSPELVLRRVPLERVGMGGPLPAARRPFGH